MHQPIFSFSNEEIATELSMAAMNDEWTEIIKLAQVLMPERPTSALKRYLCDEKERQNFGSRKNEIRNSSAN